MADGIILAQDTYDRLMKMLEKWEKGQIVELGEGLKNLETGTGYQKIGVNPSSGFPTLTLDVCIDGSPVSKTFLVTG